ncbi:MAG: FecR domain-containing protein [Haliscomenobacter sp.]|nr:FecR domain-containing protein [Haliscomenobacter sp.]
MDDNYANYSALDFAQEPSFIRWVRAGDGEAASAWERWLTDHPDRAGDVEQARRIVLAIQVREAEPAPETLSSIWNAIQVQTEEVAIKPMVPVRRTLVRRLIPYAAAASVALLAWFFLAYNPTKVVLTENAQQLALDLPDGSRVNVNAATELTYQPKSWKKERRVHLEGEAFFQVEKGEPFIVETDLGKVEVLGTSFNVKSREGYFEVDCFTGKVRVTNQNGSMQVLNPGQSTRIDLASGALTTPAVYDPGLTATWREGKFYFQEATLKEVFLEISRQYNVEITTAPEILGRKTTTFFELGNLDSALYKVCWPMQLNAKREGNVVNVE